MSYETEHVRNMDNDPQQIIGLPTFTELLTNANLATLYTAIRESTATTGPELVDATAVSKKTVYQYLGKLEQAGLITKTEIDGGASVYEPADFELTLSLRETELAITPELVSVVAQEETYPVIGRVRDEYGLTTFVFAHDLVKAHNNGEVTLRQIEELTGLSAGLTYDLVKALYEIHGLGDDEPTTYTPADVADGNSDLRDLLGDQ